MKNNDIAMLILFLLFLLYSNPRRAELDNQLRSTMNHNFVKGVAKYLNVNLREAFSGDSSVNCFLFSYLNVGRKGYYIGIGGIWIDPHYWSTVSGWTAVIAALLSSLRILKWRNISEALTVFFSIIFFISFSDPVEVKMGRHNIATLIILCSICSAAVMRFTTGIRNPRDVPVHLICRACASAFLIYLAKAANSPNKVFLIEGMVIPKTFRWNGMELEYSQVALANILCQVTSMDYVGLSGSFIGAVIQDILRWFTD